MTASGASITRARRCRPNRPSMPISLTSRPAASSVGRHPDATDRFEPPPPPQKISAGRNVSARLSRNRARALLGLHPRQGVFDDGEQIGAGPGGGIERHYVGGGKAALPAEALDQQLFDQSDLGANHLHRRVVGSCVLAQLGIVGVPGSLRRSRARDPLGSQAWRAARRRLHAAANRGRWRVRFAPGDRSILAAPVTAGYAVPTKRPGCFATSADRHRCCARVAARKRQSGRRRRRTGHRWQQGRATPASPSRAGSAMNAHGKVPRSRRRAASGTAGPTTRRSP